MIKQSNLTRAIAKTQFDYIPFLSGMDMVTPGTLTRPGSLSDCLNYEININGGYTGILGYERFDGRASPSAAVYYKLDVTITGSLTVGDTVEDTTTSGTGEIVAIDTSGAQAYIIITQIMGSLGDASTPHDLEVSAVVEATTDGIMIANSAPTEKLNAYYQSLAADSYRTNIDPVAGAGAILGVWLYKDVVYAFRNHTGGATAKMWKSSVGGWTEVALGRELAFTIGGGVPQLEITDGMEIEGMTSGAKATVGRVVTESGSWTEGPPGTAAGRFVFQSQSGNFVAETVKVTALGGATALATIAGNSTAISLLPNGRYSFENHNFTGFAGAEKMYGCDGVNYGFEFDGTNFVKIHTGMVADRPQYLAIHKEHLFYAYFGSIQHSGIGVPHNWTALAGAAEISVGFDITGFNVQPGDAGGGTLGVYTENRIFMLYGSHAGTGDGAWEIVQYRREVGAHPHSIQEFGLTLFMDDRGISELKVAQDFGNFSHNLISRLVQPFLLTRKHSVTDSCVVRDKSQYRVFFNDGSALYLTMDNQKVLGIMIENYDDVVRCCFSMEKSNGEEMAIFGSDDGFVYQMDKGYSFDGGDINRLLVLHYNHAKSPRIEKTYFDIVFDVTGAGYSEFTFHYTLGYGDTDIPQPGGRLMSISLSQAIWDEMIWDNFIWDGVVLLPAVSDLSGSGENISLVISSLSNYFAPLNHTGSQLRYCFRTQMRS